MRKPKEVKKLEYYEKKVSQLPVSTYLEIIKEANLEDKPSNVQLKMVAAFWRQKDLLQISNAKNLVIPCPPYISEYIFNDLCFVLWAMPQDNPMPHDLYEKMMHIKKCRLNNIPITPEEELTPQEKIIWMDNLIWRGGNEHFGIEIVGSTSSGLPFGQDRLLLIWIITQALKFKEPKVIGFYMKDFFDYFGINNSGRSYDRLEERFDRLKETSVRVWWTTEGKKVELRCNYLDTVSIIRPKKKVNQESEPMNIVTLSISLWLHLAKQNYVLLHPQVVKELKDKPGALDLYQWACAYCFRQNLKTIPLQSLAMQLGLKKDQPTRYKKRAIKKWIQDVNDIVNRADITGQGTNFRLEMKESPENQVILYPNNKFLA